MGRAAGLEFHVYGRVQGVGFRYSTVRTARSLGLRGFVRNASDGSVEGYAEGSAVGVNSFVAWLKQGPPSADVENLVSRSRELLLGDKEFTDFTIAW